MRAGLVAALITVVAIQGVNSNYGGFDNLYSSIHGLFGNGGNYYGNYKGSSSSSGSYENDHKKCEKCNNLRKFHPGPYNAGRLPGGIYVPIQAPEFTYFYHKGCKKAIITCPATDHISLIVAKVKDHTIPDPGDFFPDDISPLAVGARVSTVVKCEGKKKWKAQELFTDEWVKFTEVACLPIVNLTFTGTIGSVSIGGGSIVGLLAPLAGTKTVSITPP